MSWKIPKALQEQKEDSAGRKGEVMEDETNGAAVQCPNEKCDGTQAYFYQLQIRSADEPMTTFYKVSGLFVKVLFVSG